MSLPSITKAPRHGFTLIELLVVIGIIATLIALISIAAIRALHRAVETRTATDIGQLSAAMDNFKTSFKVKNPPSRIKLSTTANYPNRAVQGSLDADSVQYLTSLFPRIDLSGATTLDWTGSGQAGDFILEGDQCLVFFLGGIPAGIAGGTRGCTGFSTNPANPADNTGAFSRTPPFYDFKSSRLTQIPHNASGNAPFFSYVDGFALKNPPPYNIPGVNEFYPDGMPYLYFSSYKTANGYNRYFAQLGNSDFNLKDPRDTQPLVATFPPIPVFPYAEASSPSTRFLRPDTYQIISAGANGRFGLGTNPLTGPLWSPGTAQSVYPQGSDGADDMSNFSDRPLGINN
jgi:prepilin-type N-terminal cleavage/methylation domain-containing protein